MSAWANDSFDLFLPADRILREEAMKKHTSFRVGGPADFFLRPCNVDEVSAVLHRCRELDMPYEVIGNGTNLLVSDEGIRGAVIQIGDGFSKINVEGTTITAGAGVLLSQLAQTALRHSLHGLAFAAGIPGSLGGACVMNAGAYGGEMKDVLKNICVLTKLPELVLMTPEELELSYRHSLIPARGDIVLAASVELAEGDPEVIKAEMDDLAARRREKQPLEYPSAGSTFKRPAGHYAGQLIMEAGLAGLSVGDARVSEKHCGFIVNQGNATAGEIYSLMQEVIARVEAHSGVTLTPEVRLLGAF